MFNFFPLRYALDLLTRSWQNLAERMTRSSKSNRKQAALVFHFAVFRISHLRKASCHAVAIQEAQHVFRSGTEAPIIARTNMSGTGGMSSLRQASGWLWTQLSPDDLDHNQTWVPRPGPQTPSTCYLKFSSLSLARFPTFYMTSGWLHLLNSCITRIAFPPVQNILHLL